MRSSHLVFTAHCPLPTAHCPLPTAHCLLPTALEFPDLQVAPLEVSVFALQADVALGDLDRLAGRDDDVIEGDLGAGADDFEANLLPGAWRLSQPT